MQEANDEQSNTQAKIEGSIKIAAGGDFAENTIAPLIDAFARQHCGLSITIDFNSRNMNLVDNNFYFAIRYGELKDSSDIVIKLTQRRLRFAASTEYLSIHGNPEHPTELSVHRCITSSHKPCVYVEGDTKKSLNVKSIWQSNNGRVLVNNTINGNGIVYLPEDTVAFYDHDNILVTILDEYALTAVPSWIVMPQPRYVPLRVRLLIEFIQQGLGQWVIFLRYQKCFLIYSKHVVE